MLPCECQCIENGYSTSVRCKIAMAVGIGLYFDYSSIVFCYTDNRISSRTCAYCNSGICTYECLRISYCKKTVETKQKRILYIFRCIIRSIDIRNCSRCSYRSNTFICCGSGKGSSTAERFYGSNSRQGFIL